MVYCSAQELVLMFHIGNAARPKCLNFCFFILWCDSVAAFSNLI